MAKQKQAKETFPQRNRKPRQFKEAILIVCEGLKTEPNYFQALKNELQLPLIDIQIIPAHGVGITVVRTAKDLRDERAKAAKKATRRGDQQFAPPFDEVWCVFDKERIEDNPTFFNAVKMAQDNGFLVAVSNPSFELWYLLHFEETSRPFENADAVIHALKKHIPDYTKSIDLYSLLVVERDTAIKRADGLAQFSSDEDPYPNPFTGVYRLIKKLLSMK